MVLYTFGITREFFAKQIFASQTLWHANLPACNLQRVYLISHQHHQGICYLQYTTPLPSHAYFECKYTERNRAPLSSSIVPGEITWTDKVVVGKTQQDFNWAIKCNLSQMPAPIRLCAWEKKTRSICRLIYLPRLVGVWELRGAGTRANLWDRENHPKPFAANASRTIPEIKLKHTKHAARRRAWGIHAHK